MRSLYLIVVLVSFFSFCAIAQITTTIQTIEATDGYIYEGWLIDNIDGLIRFENVEGDTLEFYQDEIIQYIHPDDYFIYKHDRFHFKKGVYSNIDFAVGGVDTEFSLQFTFTYGKRVTPKLLLGMGTGFNFSGEQDVLAGQEFLGEVYVASKYYLNNKRFRPFIDTKVGGVVGIEKSLRNDLHPGLILQGGIGIEFAQKTQTRLAIKFNYLYMFALAKVISQTKVLDDLSLKRTLIGISFIY